MKKFLSVILALVLVLSLSTVAFADDTAVTYKPTEAFTFKQIYKSYKSENDVQVAETLSFSVVADTNNPDSDAVLTVDNLDVSKGLDITVNVPSFSKAGIYKYTISEVEGSTAGVTYTDATIEVGFLVEYDNENHALKIGNTTYIIKDSKGNKIDTFENTFKSGKFTVAKDVQGNMANVNDEFEIVVTLTSAKPVGTPITVGGQSVAATAWTKNDAGAYVYTTTLTLSEADGATAFADIPVGVKVAVAENQAEEKMNGYEYKSGEVTSLVIADDTAKDVVIVNEKNTNIDTGISLDSMPYVVLLTVAVLGVAVVLTKKRIAE